VPLVNMRRMTMQNTDFIDRVLPAHAIWAFFEGLAAAACYMKRGALPYDPSPPDWEELIHLDIKPNNVFLAEPHETIWPGIPQVKVRGDTCVNAICSVDTDDCSWAISVA